MREQLDAIQESLGLLFSDQDEPEDMEIENADVTLVEAVHVGELDKEEEAADMPRGMGDVDAGQVEQDQQLAQHHEDREMHVEPEVQTQPRQDGHGEEGEQLLLRPRVLPVVPPPGDMAPSWAAIDSLGGWDSFLCKFPCCRRCQSNTRAPGHRPGGRCCPGGSRWSQSRRPPGPSCGWASWPRRCSQDTGRGVQL